MKLNNFLAPLKSRWHLWLFPLLALLFCGWYLQKYYEEKGIEVIISFSDAKAIQPEKTRVFFRGVPVGVVHKITISEDGTRAECFVYLQKNAIQFAVDGTQFYLVSPTVSFEGVSGLETIISGSYIALEPGELTASKKHKFRGELSKQSLDPEENTTAYTLETPHAESISPGDNLFFRGIPIGTVGEVKLNKTAQKVLIRIHVRHHHNRLIRTNTVFWKKPGIKADMGLFGSKIKFNSLDTILRGGIELSTPLPAGKRAASGATFFLLGDEPKEMEKWNPPLTYKQ